MQNNVYKLTIDNTDFDIDFVQFLDICCSFLKPLKKVNKHGKYTYLNVQTDKTKGIFRFRDLFNICDTYFKPLETYLRIFYDTTFCKDIGDYDPEFCDNKEKTVIGFSNSDNFAFTHNYDMFTNKFLQWAEEQFSTYNNGTTTCRRVQVEEICEILHININALEDAIVAIINNKPLITATAQKLDRVYRNGNNPLMKNYPMTKNNSILFSFMQNVIKDLGKHQ